MPEAIWIEICDRYTLFKSTIKDPACHIKHPRFHISETRAQNTRIRTPTDLAHTNNINTKYQFDSMAARSTISSS